MNAKKKWLSGLLAAGLLLNLLPMTAMAASAENCEDADCPHAAAVGTTHFDTVQEAVNSESAETVTLLKDTSEDVTIADGQNIVLDLDGHTLTNSSNHTLVNNGTLTICGEGVVDNVTHGKAALYNNGACTIENGTFSRSQEASTSTSDSGSNSWYVVYNAGSLTINGGIIKFSDENDGKYSSLVINRGQNAVLTVNDGTLVSGFIALKDDEQGKVLVNGGIITGADQAVQCWGTMNIAGGTMNGAVYAWAAAWSDVDERGDITISDDAVINGDVASVQYIDGSAAEASLPANIAISGGTITGEVFTAFSGTEPDAPAVLTVSGGTFTRPVDSAYLGDDVAAYLSGNSGYVYYTDLEKAKNDAQSGDILTTVDSEEAETYYTVTSINGDTQTVQIVKTGESITLDPPDAPDGYSFDGWYLEDMQVEFPYTVTGSVSFTAKWTENPAPVVSDSDDDDDEPSYRITVATAENGRISANVTSAEAGHRVTLTVIPYDGYKLSNLLILDESGNDMDWEELEDSQYAFILPEGNVTVEAEFVRLAAEVNFVDVAADAYYSDAIAWAVGHGITSGTTTTTFSPNNACTRAQMVTFLWRAAGCPAPSSDVCPFMDLDSDAYYYNAVLWAVEQGITTGVTSDRFAPDGIVTRAQTATFLFRNAGSPDMGDGTCFKDVAVDAYYCDAVLWAAMEGITSGMTASQFAPDNICTRAQIVTFIYRSMR